MKRALLFASVLALILTVAAPAWAIQTAVRSYRVHLGTADSGNTTTAVSGVHALVLDGEDFKRSDGLTTIKDASYLQSGNGILTINTVTVSQAQQGAGGSYSGNTFYMAAKSIPANGNWDLAELVPITPTFSLSSTTAFNIPFQIEPGKQTRFYFVSSGVTPYDAFSADVQLGLPASAWKPPELFVIAEGTFTMPGNNGVNIGVSQWGTGTTLGRFPDGVKYAEYSVSGASRFYTTNGDTPSVSGNGTGTHVADLNGFSLSGNEARNVKFAHSGTACNIRYRFLSRKP
jgi:hypothetical protein